MRTNKGPYSPQPMRQFGNARTDRLQKPGQFGGPKPMSPLGGFGAMQSPFGSQPSLGRSQQAFGQLQNQFNGGMQGSPSVTGPQGGIPGLPGYDPNANVQGIGGPQPPQMGGAPAMGGQISNDPYAGLSGSEIFARLFGQTGPRP